MPTLNKQKLRAQSKVTTRLKLIGELFQIAVSAPGKQETHFPVLPRTDTVNIYHKTK
jgi:hypothetical protein